MTLPLIFCFIGFKKVNDPQIRLFNEILHIDLYINLIKFHTIEPT